MAEFTLGARASCSDGFCGVVSRTILDPAARTVTHLVIGPRHGEGGRLVPLDLVEVAAGEIRLRCTLDEYSRLDPAEETELVGGGYGGVGAMAVGGSLPGMGIGMGVGYRPAPRWWSSTPSRWERSRWSAMRACTPWTATSGRWRGSWWIQPTRR